MKLKLELRLPREILITSDKQMIPPLQQKSEEKLKRLSLKVKEENENAGLNINFQETKIKTSGPITSWKTDGEAMETVGDYFSGLQNHCRW